MKMHTTHRTAKFLSSQQMENSKMRKRIINLGEALVKELGLDPGTDTLSRWMAHYIAEQLTIAKKSTGDAKIKAEQQCFETVLKLWQHRSYLPTGIRPFESFDPVFRALERLDPENTTPYFYSGQSSAEKGDSGENSDDVQIWLDIAQVIDQVARVWLEFVFQQAALTATDETTIKWLENAVNRPGKDDVSIIVHLIGSELEDIEETTEQEQQYRQDKLKARIEQLDAFNNFNQMLRKAWVTELSALKQKNSSKDNSVDMDLKK